MTQYIFGLISGIIIGAYGKYLGDKLTDARKSREASAAQSKLFGECQQQMPALFAEMRTDLAATPLAREFVVIAKAWGYGAPSHKLTLTYYMDDHAQLSEKVGLLLRNGLVSDITPFGVNVNRYEMTEAFAKQLTADTNAPTAVVSA